MSFWKFYRLGSNIIESTNLASTVLYVFEAYQRAHSLAAAGEGASEAAALFVAAATSLLLTLFFSVMIPLEHAEKNGPDKEKGCMQCLSCGTLACSVTYIIAIMFACFPLPWTADGGLQPRGTLVALIVILSLASAGALFVWMILASGRNLSAALQLPVFGAFVVFHLDDEQLAQVEGEHREVATTLLIFQDIPEILLGAIDIYLFGGSYFAMLDLILSVVEVVWFINNLAESFAKSLRMPRSTVAPEPSAVGAGTEEVLEPEPRAEGEADEAPRPSEPSAPREVPEPSEPPPDLTHVTPPS